MFRRYIKVGVLLLVLTIPFQAAIAQSPGIPHYAMASAHFAHAVIAAGGTAILDVELDVSPGFHINSVKPNDPDLIATAVAVTPVKGFSESSQVFPPAKTISSPALSAKPLSVYVGKNRIAVSLKSVKDLKPGQYRFPISVSFQGCNSNSCFPPSTVNLIAALTVK